MNNLMELRIALDLQSATMIDSPGDNRLVLTTHSGDTVTIGIESSDYGEYHFLVATVEPAKRRVARTSHPKRTFVYDRNNAGVVYRISTDGMVLAESDPDNPQDKDLMEALKRSLPAIGSRFYATQWRRLAGWPKE